ncbi:F-box protein SKIP22-like [Camellia sinensis]|nr:F-box protein SKIP22-like [Camellia sinensis]
MDDGGDESMEVGEGDRGNHKLLVIVVHAIMIDSGFVRFDSVSRRRVEGFYFPDEWPSLQFIISLPYTLLEIIKQGLITINGIETVKLKFQSLGKFVNVYGSLAKNDFGLYGVCLGEEHLVFFLNLIWANCDSIGEMNGKESFSNSHAAREVFEFLKIVKDKPTLPLLIDLCERAGLAPPPCFMRLPTDLKLKILESLRGVDVANVGSVCSEFCYLSSNDDL